jgi:membrane fusion protein (multidrug efflux system)
MGRSMVAFRPALFRRFILSFALLFPLVTPAQSQAPATVSVVTVEKRPVTEGARFVGRIEAVERVDIRARVTGYLDEVLFKDGERVKTGAPLYRIEKAPFEAAVQQAEAAVRRNRAQLENAEVQRKRAEELLTTSATSVAVRDDRIAAEKTAQGNLAAAEAELKSAKINLAYTDITAPIDGQIGRTAVTRGNVVSPDSGTLTTIVSADPMYVTFPVSQREFLRFAEKGYRARQMADHLKVVVYFSNGTAYDHSGKIDFVDVKVDRATDTVMVRATMPNPDGILVDGQLVQVNVEGEKPQEQVLVPQVALIADQQGIYVFVVEDGKVAVRRLKLGQTVGGSQVVTEGLNGGELVVVTGQQSLRPGLAVTAIPVQKPVGG